MVGAGSGERGGGSFRDALVPGDVVVEWGDVSNDERGVIDGLVNFECEHAGGVGRDECGGCGLKRKVALGEWCNRHKKRARDLVRVKTLKRAGAAAAQEGEPSRVVKQRLSWSEVSSNSVWAGEILSISRQWQICDAHERFRYATCEKCKRARDTAQAKWEEVHPAKVMKIMRKRPVIVVHPLTRKFMRKYDIADMEVT